MIPIKPKQEPANFDSEVRKPGNEFLSRCHEPRKSQWEANRYWRKINNDLYKAYGGICAYTGEWFSLASSHVSVDHFIPKCVEPSLAYEWSNYRLTTQKANNNKGDAIGIADPFKIKAGWFVLDTPSCLIKPGTKLSGKTLESVEHYITILRLNDEVYVQSRCDIIIEYINREISREYLAKKYPYIYNELTRQNLWEKIELLFRGYKE